MPSSLDALLDSDDARIFEIETNAVGPEGKLPLTPEMLLRKAQRRPLRLTQNVGMGWDPAQFWRKQVPDPQHAGRHPRARTARRSRSAITPGTGRSAC